MKTWIKAVVIACLAEAVVTAPFLLWRPKVGVDDPWIIRLIMSYHYVAFFLAFWADSAPIRKLLGENFAFWLFFPLSRWFSHCQSCFCSYD